MIFFDVGVRQEGEGWRAEGCGSAQPNRGYGVRQATILCIGLDATSGTRSACGRFCDMRSGGVAVDHRRDHRRPRFGAVPGRCPGPATV